MTILKSVTSQVTSLKKRVDRERKVMEKKARGRVKKPVDPNKPPSGFAKPGPISPELAKFLGLGEDELIARTEVTKRITEYCKKHDLQKKEDGRHICSICESESILTILEIEQSREFVLSELDQAGFKNLPNNVKIVTIDHEKLLLYSGNLLPGVIVSPKIKGYTKSLNILSKYIKFKKLRYPSGKKVFDWTVPKEWVIKDAYVKLDGKKIIDFKKNNLHVLNYSAPVNKTMSLKELNKHLYSLKKRPNIIPRGTGFNNVLNVKSPK